MSALDVDPDAPICPSGKRPIRDEATATARLRSARHDAQRGRRGRKPGHIEAGAYRCTACGWWHLTTMTTRRRTRRT